MNSNIVDLGNYSLYTCVRLCEVDNIIIERKPVNLEFQESGGMMVQAQPSSKSLNKHRCKCVKSGKVILKKNSTESFCSLYLRGKL